MAREFYFVEVRSMAEGDRYRPYEHRRGMLAVYKHYNLACEALHKLENKYECIRIVRNDGVVIREYKKLFQGG